MAQPISSNLTERERERDLAKDELVDIIMTLRASRGRGLLSRSWAQRQEKL